MSRTRTVECPIIVGRDDVLELLDAAVAAGAKGRGRTLFLSGQAGLGKTRLIWATVRKAEAAGIRVGAGSVAPQDHSVPLASIREFATGIRGEAWPGGRCPRTSSRSTVDTTATRWAPAV